jgi:plasmid stabilization system protein ParE
MSILSPIISWRRWRCRTPIEQAVGLLREHPRLGRPGRVFATRGLVVAAYPASLVVYENAGRAVHILAGMYGRQQWPTRCGDRKTCWGPVWGPSDPSYATSSRRMLPP